MTAKIFSVNSPLLQRESWRKWDHVHDVSFCSSFSLHTHTTGWHRTTGSQVTHAIKRQKSWRTFGTCTIVSGERSPTLHTFRNDYNEREDNQFFIQVNDGIDYGPRMWHLAQVSSHFKLRIDGLLLSLFSAGKQQITSTHNRSRLSFGTQCSKCECEQQLIRVWLTMSSANRKRANTHSNFAPLCVCRVHLSTRRHLTIHSICHLFSPAHCYMEHLYPKHTFYGEWQSSHTGSLVDVITQLDLFYCTMLFIKRVHCLPFVIVEQRIHSTRSLHVLVQ